MSMIGGGKGINFKLLGPLNMEEYKFVQWMISPDCRAFPSSDEWYYLYFPKFGVRKGSLNLQATSVSTSSYAIESRAYYM